MKCAIPCPYDTAGTPCQLDMFHAGNHSWPLVIDMEGWLPICRQCGGKAARCGCPAMSADGLSNAVPPSEEPPSDAMMHVFELNALMHWPESGGTARRHRDEVMEPVDVRPWCPRHGWGTRCGCSDKPEGYR